MTTAVPVAVETASAVTVEATGPVTHLCPHRDEIDHGTVTITWVCEGRTIELHSLGCVPHRLGWLQGQPRGLRGTCRS